MKYVVSADLNTLSCRYSYFAFKIIYGLTNRVKKDTRVQRLIID